MEVTALWCCCYTRLYFCCTMPCIAQTLLLQDVRSTLCLSVTLRYFVEMVQHMIILLSPLGRHIILVFALPNVMAIFQRGPP